MIDKEIKDYNNMQRQLIEIAKIIHFYGGSDNAAIEKIRGVLIDGALEGIQIQEESEGKELEEDVDRILEEYDWNYDKIDFYEFAKHFFELGMAASNKAQKQIAVPLRLSAQDGFRK